MTVRDERGEKIVTAEEFAREIWPDEATRPGEKSLRRLRKEVPLPATRIGGRFYYPLESARAALLEHLRRSGGTPSFRH